jgi:hypothetical protein
VFVCCVCGLCFMFVCLFVCLSFSPFINEMIRNSPACLRKKKEFCFFRNHKLHKDDLCETCHVAWIANLMIIIVS